MYPSEKRFTLENANCDWHKRARIIGNVALHVACRIVGRTYVPDTGVQSVYLYVCLKYKLKYSFWRCTNLAERNPLMDCHCYFDERCAARAYGEHV